jgi:tetratricopeptide (TPR) repeat protein/predicted aspartyl protease
MWGGTAILALVASALVFGARAEAAECKLGKIADLPVTMSDLTPTVSAKINGADTKLIADTGAFFSILTPQGTAKFHLKVGPAPFGLVLEGVNGQAQTELTTVDTFTVMGAPFRHTDFLVAAPQLSYLADGLLGANFLTAADAEFDLANGAIRLLATRGDCAKVSLAYWAGDRPYSMMDIPAISRQLDQIRGEVKVNGVAFKATFDTGAPRSILTRWAARAAGLKLDGPGVKPGGMSGGIGRGLFQTWIVPVASFKIGDEEVRNTELRVGDIELNGDAMLIGADFFLSHRVLVAKSQSKLYFSYNGGPVFNLDNAQGASTTVASGAATGAGGGDEPKDADGYSRRGAADMARQQYDNAVADFGHASDLAPGNPKPLIDRGAAYWRKGDTSLALADFTAALKLKPDNSNALLWRGVLRLGKGDEAGAGADFDAALKADPDKWGAVAYAYVDADKFAEAVARYDAWITANPKSVEMPLALNNRCWARGLWGKQLDQAEADCDAALRLSPGDGSILDSRGLVRLRRGELDKAIADYDAALRAANGNGWSLYGRGLAELRKGLTAKGEADLAAAAKADPHLAEHARKLSITP